MKMTGSQVVVKELLRQGVEVVFGYPGGAIMPLYDALYDSTIRHILTVHEQAAAHAADGYARASGRVGVCMATSGPGATNLVTGLATAYMDSIPMVAITGQVATNLLGRDAFQEIDITGLTMSITKHSFLVRNTENLSEIIEKAFAIAATGRPGPVLIDIPRDVLLATVSSQISTKPVLKCTLAEQAINELEEAVSVLSKAVNPVVVVGGGVKTAKACPEVLKLVQSKPMPVVSTLMGLGAFPGNHPCFLGLTGMHGLEKANLSVRDADVIVALGTRFSDRVTGEPSSYAAGKTIIHLDVDPSEFAKNVLTKITIAGDLKESLTNLTLRLAEKLHHKRIFVSSVQQPAKSEDEGGLTPQWIFRHMSEAADVPVTWVTDVGQHQMWAAQHLQINDPYAWVTSGGLGTMGFGLPAAMGAQAACPGRRTILIAGDGGFKMNGLELYTVVNEGLPVICIIFNNKSLGMVRQWQKLFFNERYVATSLRPFNFSGFAAVLGVTATQAATKQEFADAFSNALAVNAPVMIVVDLDEDLMVKPMVYPGRPIDNFI